MLQEIQRRLSAVGFSVKTEESASQLALRTSSVLVHVVTEVSTAKTEYHLASTLATGQTTMMVGTIQVTAMREAWRHGSVRLDYGQSSGTRCVRTGSTILRGRTLLIAGLKGLISSKTLISGWYHLRSLSSYLSRSLLLRSSIVFLFAAAGTRRKRRLVNRTRRKRMPLQKHIRNNWRKWKAALEISIMLTW